MVYLTLIRSRWSYDNFSPLWGCILYYWKSPLQRCAKLEHAVAVVFERRLFSTKDCMWPCTESMKRHADDGCTIHIYIPYIARIAIPFMWSSLRLAPINTYNDVLFVE